METMVQGCFGKCLASHTLLYITALQFKGQVKIDLSADCQVKATILNLLNTVILTPAWT